jgi:hypothetical protein
MPDRPTRTAPNPKVFEALTKNNVLNRAVTLDDIIKASSDISGIAGDHNLAAWTFISPNYVYTGDDALIDKIGNTIKTPQK